MINVSTPNSVAPTDFKSPLHQKIYQAFSALNIEFLRVENDDCITMDDCIAIEQALGHPVAKTLLVCNRQQTNFYLYVTRGDKPFVTKDFSHSLEISRVSFASEQQLFDICGTKIGATTMFSCLLDSAKSVQIVIDKEIADDEYYVGTDGLTTSYIKLKTSDILEKVLPYAGAKPIIL